MRAFSKAISLFAICVSAIILTGCGSKYVLDIQNDVIKRSPSLDVEFQASSINSDSQISVYQEVRKEDNINNLDSLIIKTEYSEDASISSYVQKELNILKSSGYDISLEKSKKNIYSKKDQKLGTLLKTYIIKINDQNLHLAQLFIKKDSKIGIISYASTDIKHIKTFTKQLKDIQFSF